MKAISLWEPWATFIMMKQKTIETRTHNRFKSLVVKRIAICSALNFDKSGIWKEYLPPDSPLRICNLLSLTTVTKGTIMCTATVSAARWAPNVDFVEREEWNRKAMCEVGGKFCLFLDDIKPLMSSISIRGRQGIFEVPDDLIGGL